MIGTLKLLKIISELYSAYPRKGQKSLDELKQSRCFKLARSTPSNKSEG